MSDTKNKKSSRGRTAEELYMRRMVCMSLIKTLDNMEDSFEKKDAMEHYKKQLAKLDGEITEVTGRPPDIVVGLQPAQLTAQALKG